MRRARVLVSGGRRPDLASLPRTSVVSFKSRGRELVVTLATELSAIGLLIELKRLKEGSRLALLDYAGRRPRGRWFGTPR